MNHIVKYKKSTKSPLSNAQRMFNRLKKKVVILQTELCKLQKRLDEALAFYYETMDPGRKVIQKIYIEFVKISYKYYKNQLKFFTKNEQRILKELILNKTMDIFESIPFVEIDLGIRAIFKDIGGMDPEKMMSDRLKSFQQEMAELFSGGGFDLDLSKLNLTDDEMEFKQKILESMRDAVESAVENEEPLVKPKSKKEIQKEMKARELEDLQNKGLGTIYKQLAKVFHPDLEQNPEQKVEKEKLMKRLTNAYENNDLHTLLSLEMEWMNGSNQKEKVQSDDQLKIYNSILKDQIDDLQANIQFVLFHPKYMSIHFWIEEVASTGCIVLRMEYQKLKAEIDRFQGYIQNLRGASGAKFLQSILQEYLQMESQGRHL